MLTVIDPTPEPLSLKAPIGIGALGVVGILGAAASNSFSVFSVTATLIGGGWAYLKKREHARDAEDATKWLGAIRATIDDVASRGELPVVPAPIALRSGEICHWVAEVEWREFRSETVRVNYSGSSVSIPIMKGVRYRVGTVRPQRETTMALKPIDRGTLMITNKRIFFDGKQKNSTIELRNLQAVKLSRELLILDKSAGKDPHLAVLRGDNAILGAVVLAQLLAVRGGTEVGA